MQIPAILYVSAASQGLPVVAYALAQQRTRSAAYIAIGGAVSVISNMIALFAAPILGNNQVFSYISSPITLGMFLLALADWQASPRERNLVRLGVLPLLVVWILLVAFVEDVRNFDLVTGPLYALLLLAAGLWTILRRAGMTEAQPLARTDWFWVSLGLALSGATTAMASPIGAILVERGRLDLFDLAWQTRGACITASFSMVSYGVYRGPMVSKFSTAP